MRRLTGENQFTIIHTGTAQTWEVQSQSGKMRYLCHPELKNRVGARGFKVGRAIHRKIKRCLVVWCLPWYTDGLLRLNLSVVITLIWQRPQFRYFYVFKGGVKVSLKSVGSHWTSRPESSNKPKWHIWGQVALGPLRTFGKVWKHFRCCNLRGKCYRHLWVEGRSTDNVLRCRGQSPTTESALSQCQEWCGSSESKLKL